ncbi:MAG: hypothetical protein IKD09_01145 [Lentisphaeria bacterium]|nr:hypothetical protein [Lentisphaeria bacterium]
MLLAASNFQYDRNNGILGFSPVIKNDFTSFWALGDLWGTYTSKNTEFSMQVLHGEFLLKELKLDFSVEKIYVNNKEAKLPVTIKEGDLVVAKK